MQSNAAYACLHSNSYQIHMYQNEIQAVALKILYVYVEFLDEISQDYFGVCGVGKGQMRTM